MSKKKYTADMPGKIYAFFRDYADLGAPSLTKFAARVGITLEELRCWRENAEFDRACKECAELRRDYLIDAALSKRHDSSLTKFLLAAEFGMGEEEGAGDNRLEVTLEVLGE